MARQQRPKEIPHRKIGALTPEAGELSDAYYLTFESPHGRVVLMDLLKRFGGQTFVEGAPDVSAFKAGSREVLLHINKVRNRKEAVPIVLEEV